MTPFSRSAARLVACLAVVACGGSADPNAPAVKAAAEAITADGLLALTSELAADSMEGRAPGTWGEEKATAYLGAKFRMLGLTPGNPDGSWIQKVDLIGYRSTPTATITARGRAVPMRYREDFVASSRHDRDVTKVDASDIVFVGYGIVAPEFGWDDYKGVDVKGKTIVMLVGDPPIRSAGDSAQLDSAMFKGKAMTYYGRWTYKYEIATAKGAAAALIVHETGPAGYPWSVPQGSFTSEQFDIVATGENTRVPVEGWIHLDKVRALFAAAGQDFDKLHAAARQKDFTPVALDAKASFDVKVARRRIQSKNVVAKIDGTDRKDEWVIYTAHWDGFGRDTTLKGDQVNNGALDNATGCAALIEIAEAFMKLPAPPSRSILFLAVTAEERGLLGAKFYASNPLYPLAKTAANINIDGINQWGRTSDFTVIGLGNSTLDDVLTSILRADGRTVRPDAEPEKGFYYRSDHFEFAKQGVPAMHLDAGTTFIGKPADFGMKKRDEYTNKDYHLPTDEVKPDWDLGGAADDMRALFRTGYVVAQQPAFPEWKPGTEFKAKREAMLRKP